MWDIKGIAAGLFHQLLCSEYIWNHSLVRLQGSRCSNRCPAIVGGNGVFSLAVSCFNGGCNCTMMHSKHSTQCCIAQTCFLPVASQF